MDLHHACAAVRCQASANLPHVGIWQARVADAYQTKIRPRSKSLETMLLDASVNPACRTCNSAVCVGGARLCAAVGSSSETNVAGTTGLAVAVASAGNAPHTTLAPDPHGGCVGGRRNAVCPVVARQRGLSPTVGPDCFRLSCSLVVPHIDTLSRPPRSFPFAHHYYLRVATQRAWRTSDMPRRQHSRWRKDETRAESTLAFRRIRGWDLSCSCSAANEQKRQGADT